MDPAHVVLLIAVAITVVAIAGYLIAIVLILKHVVDRLVTILGAVQAVTDTSGPVGPIIDDINRDLDAGRKLMESTVERLESSRVPVGATADYERHGVEPLDRPAAVVAPRPAPPAIEREDPSEPPPRTGGRGWWNR